MTRSISIFAATSLLSFVALVPSLGFPLNVVTVQAVGCPQVMGPPGSGATFECPFQAGTPFGSGVAGVYFDYSCWDNNTLDLFLNKVSYTGTSYVDTKTVYCSNAPYYDSWLSATSSNQNPNAYDYWTAVIAPTAPTSTFKLLGMALRSI